MMLLEALRIFDLKTDYSEGAVQQKYYELIRKFPPERYPDQFMEIQQAYEVLKNPREAMKLLTKQVYETTDSFKTLQAELASSGEVIRFPVEKLFALGK